MGVKHLRQAENAFAPENSPTLPELLQDVPFVPVFDKVSEHSLYNLYVPINATDARSHFNKLMNAIYTSIYASIPVSSRIRGEVREWIEVSTPEEMTIVTDSCITDDQIDFLLSCHRGEAFTVEKLSKLERVYSGGDTGDIIYMILARPRNVDGKNAWKSAYGGDLLRPYVGSTARIADFAGSQRIYEHGDARIRLKTAIQDNKDKEAYKFAFGAFAEPLVESELEPPCVAAFEILGIPSDLKIAGVVLLLEQALCQLTHSWGHNYSQQLRKQQTAKDMLPPSARPGTNESQPMESPWSAPVANDKVYLSRRNLSAEERSAIVAMSWRARKERGDRLKPRRFAGGERNLASKMAKLCTGEGLGIRGGKAQMSTHVRFSLNPIPLQWLPPYNTKQDVKHFVYSIKAQTLAGLEIAEGLSYKLTARFAGTEDAPTIEIMLSKPDGSCAVPLRDLVAGSALADSKVDLCCDRLRGLLGQDVQAWATPAARALLFERKFRLCEGMPEEGELTIKDQTAYSRTQNNRKWLAGARMTAKQSKKARVDN